MSIRRITMHQSALRLAHACERQARTVAELPSLPGIGPAAGRADAPAPAKKPAKKRAAAKRRR